MRLRYVCKFGQHIGSARPDQYKDFRQFYAVHILILESFCIWSAHISVQTFQHDGCGILIWKSLVYSCYLKHCCMPINLNHMNIDSQVWLSSHYGLTVMSLYRSDHAPLYDLSIFLIISLFSWSCSYLYNHAHMFMIIPISLQSYPMSMSYQKGPVLYHTKENLSNDILKGTIPIHIKKKGCLYI